MMLESFGEVGQDGIMAPCVPFLVESGRTAVENMNCTRSSVAERAARVRLDFPPAEIDWFGRQSIPARIMKDICPAGR